MTAPSERRAPTDWKPVYYTPKSGRLVEIAWIVNPPTVEMTKLCRWIGGSTGGHWDHWYTPTHWRPYQGSQRP